MDIGVNVSRSDSTSLSMATEQVILHPKSTGTDSSISHSLQWRKSVDLMWMDACKLCDQMQTDNLRWDCGHFNHTPLAVGQPNTGLTWQEALELGGVSFRLGSKWLLPRALLRHFNGAVRSRQRFTDVRIITVSSADALSQTEAWLYWNTCSFECLKECTTSNIVTRTFSDTHTWSWNINQWSDFSFKLSLSPLHKLQNVSLKSLNGAALTLRKYSAHNAGAPIRIIYVTQKHWRLCCNQLCLLLALTNSTLTRKICNRNLHGCMSEFSDKHGLDNKGVTARICSSPGKIEGSRTDTHIQRIENSFISTLYSYLCYSILSIIEGGK